MGLAAEQEHLDALRAELGGTVPAGIDALPADRLAELAAMVAAAKARQEQLLEEGGLTALDHLPRVLRGPFRRALGL